ncbi:hypothetical protein LINPERHAP1_LOCUS3687, partial [Linum perenne]
MNFFVYINLVCRNFFIFQSKMTQQQSFYLDITEEGHKVTNSSTQGLTYSFLRSLNHIDVHVIKGSIISKNPKAIA